MQYLLPDGASDRFIRINGFNKKCTEICSGNGKPFGYNGY